VDWVNKVVSLILKIESTAIFDLAEKNESGRSS